MSVTVDALGPKGTPLIQRYFDYVQGQRASAPARQADVAFLRLAGIRVKKTLTAGDAGVQVAERRETLGKQEPSKLAELDALTSLFGTLLDEFSDTENADLYELRKVPPDTVLAAVVALAGRGVSAAQIEDDFDLVAEQIRKARPSLSKA
jgi:hypothetical protein